MHIPNENRILLMGLGGRISALLVAMGCCLIVGFTLNQYGITWDEGSYILAGESYAGWLENPSLKSIDRYWDVNHEHPPLLKVLGGMSSRLFFEKLNILDRVTAFRMSILLFVFVLTYSLFCFSSELYNPIIALITVASFLFLPRIFFHAHLAALDYPLTAMWFLSIYWYWKGRKGGRYWIILSSIAIGCALLIKINAMLLYFPMLLSWFLFYHRERKTIPQNANASPIKQSLIGFLKLVPLLVIPPIMFFSLWPWLWKETCERVKQLILFHLNHFEIPVFYLGKVYLVAPWHYALVLTVMTVPVVILTAFIFGICGIKSMAEKRTNSFLLFNALYPIAIMSIPGVPKYDGVRLFMAAFPFLCMISGLGLSFAYENLKGRRMRPFLIGLFFVTFTISIYFSIIRIHPLQSSYFNELAGGIDGAETRGFELEYWGNAYIKTLEWLNRNCSKSFWLYMTSIDPKAYFPFVFYKGRGELKKEIGFCGKMDADYVILLIRQGLFNKEMWDYYLNEEPVFSAKLSGSNLVNIYKTKASESK